MPDKVSPSKFAASVKEKYPEYKDVDDLKLANAMIEKYPEYKDKVDFGTMVTPAAPSAVAPSQPPVSKYQKAVNDDRSRVGKLAATVYNGLVGSLESLVGFGAEAMGSLASTIPTPQYNVSGAYMPQTKKPVGIAELSPEQQAKAKKGLKKSVREGFDVIKSEYVSRKDEKKLQGQFDVTNGIGLEDIEGLVAMSGRMAGDIGLGAATGGASYFMQAYSDAVDDYDESVAKMGIKENPNARALYGVAGGTINGLLEKFAIDKIVGSGPIFKDIQKKVLANVLKNTANLTGKAAIDAIEAAAKQEIKALTSGIKQNGLRAAYRSLVEAGTEGLQAGLEDGAKFATNWAQGVDVFNEKEIKDQFFKNMLNSAAAGGVFGPVIGFGMDKTFGRNVNTQVLKDIAEANTPEQLAAINDELAATFDENNFTQEERDAVMANANRYAQIKQTLPQGTSAIAQTIAIPLIEDRIKLDNEIQNRKNNIESLDEALKPDEEASISLLEDKRSQINDDIREVVADEKFDYFEKDGKFFKQLGENAPEEISRNRFDLQQIKTGNYATQTSEGPVQEGGPAGDIGQRQGTQEGGTQKAPIETNLGDSNLDGEEISVKSLIGRRVTYQGVTGTLFQEGQTLSVETPTQIREIGNVDELSRVTPESMGIESDESLVEPTETGFMVGQDELFNANENPISAISRDQNGKVMNVVLTTKGGKRRKFRGAVAEDLAYQITLKQISNEPEFEVFLEQNADEVNAGQVQEPAQEETTGTDGQVPTTQEPAATGTGPAVTTSPVVTTEPAYGRFNYNSYFGSKKFLEGYNKLQKKVYEDANRVLDAINLILKEQGKEAFINFHNQETFERAVIEAGGSKENSTSRGFYIDADGSIHLNMDNLASDTVLHEGFHPILDILAKYNPKIINELFTELESIPEAAGIIAQAKESYTGDVTQKKEAITDFVAGVADGRIILNPSNFQKIKNFILNMLNKIGIGQGGYDLMKVNNEQDLVKLATFITEKFKTGETITFEGLEGIVGDDTADPVTVSNIAVVNPIQFEYVKTNDKAYKRVDVKWVSKGLNLIVPKIKSSLYNIVSKSGGAIVVTNSDATGIGMRKGVLRQGGIGYTFIEQNVNDNIGFAASVDAKQSAFFKAVQEAARIRDEKFPEMEGKPVAVFVMVQAPEVMFGNAYGADYFIKALSNALSNNEISTEDAKADVINYFNSIKESNATGRKYANSIDALTELIQNGNIKSAKDKKKIYELLITNRENKEDKSAKFGFDARRVLFGQFFNKVAAAKNKPGGRTRDILGKDGYNHKSFYDIYGDENVMKSLEGSTEGKKMDDGGFTMTGFFVDPTITEAEYIKRSRSGTFQHKQFNSKFAGNEPFVLDGKYYVNEVFPEARFVDEFGNPVPVTTSTAGSMYPRTRSEPQAIVERAKAISEPTFQSQKAVNKEQQQRTNSASEKLKQLFNRKNIPLNISEAKEIVNEVIDWTSWYDGISNYVNNIFGEYTEDVLSLLPLSSQAANSATTVALAINNAEKIYKGEKPVGVAEYYGYVTDFLQGKGIKSDKMYNFFKAITGDKDAIAVDMHVWSIIMGKNPNKKQVNPKNKAEFERAKEFVNLLSSELGLAPREVQAALWAANILRTGKNPTSYEQYFEKQLKKGLSERIEGWRKEGYKPFSEVRKARESVRAEGKEPQFQRVAPNGKPSNLNAQQYKQVRTPEFKNWFGDWENDPKNASKVVDENGEPLVVYHGTNATFDEFKLEKPTVGSYGQGFYASNDSEFASNYAKGEGAKMLSLFLSIKNPLQINEDKLPSGYEKYSGMENNKGLSRDFTNKLISEGYDGVYAKNQYNENELVAFKPNQIKSATANTGAFSTTDNRIQFQKVAQIGVEKQSGTTQVATTIGSYTKAAKIAERLGAKSILDYGAGLGLGTDAMSNIIQNVESYDPNPERWKGSKPVTYTNNQDISKTYDAVVNLNVLNVVPKDMRDAIVMDIFDKLNVGGNAIISTRKWKGDIDLNKNFKPAQEDKAMYVIKKGEEVYQKGFDKNELVEYIQEILGDAATVKKDNSFGNTGVVINKKYDISQPQFQKAPTKPVTKERGGIIKKGFKEQVRYGILGKENVRLKELMSGELSAELATAETRVKETMKTIKKYGGSVTEKDISDFMQGNSNGNQIPLDLATQLSEMRAQIDGLTERLIQLGVVDSQESIDYYRDNMGKYMLRSYESINFKDTKTLATLYGKGLNIDNVAKKLKNVDKTVVDAALKYLSDRAKAADPTLTDAEAMKIARADANEILSDSEDYVMNKGLTGSTNVKSLRQRKDISPEIRALMGEYTDPLYNYYSTIFKIASLTSTRQYLNSLKEFGMGNFFFNNKTEDATVKFAGDESDALAPLNGIYTFPEIKESLQIAQKETTNIFLQMAGRVRMFKTVYNPSTHVKNIIGNMGFAVSNGHWNNLPEAYKYIKGSIKGGSNKDVMQMMETLNRYGVLNNVIGVGELKSYFDNNESIDDFLKTIYNNANKSTTASTLGKAKANLSKIPKAIEKAYAIEDDVFKILAFVNESNRYAQAKYNKKYDKLSDTEKKDIDGIASEIVKDTFPTFSRVPKGVKNLSKFAFLGNFLSFPVESVRTQYNSLALARKEIKSGNTKLRRVGIARLSGALVYNSLFATLSVYAYNLAGAGLTGAIGMMFGDDEEENEMSNSIKKYLAPWNKNSEVYVSKFKDGKLEYYDIGSLDSYGYQRRVWNAFWSTKNKGEFDQMMASGIGEALDPWMAMDMVVSNLMAISRNDDGLGGKIYNPESKPMDRTKDIATFVGKQFGPGALGSAIKIADAYQKGETDKVMDELGAQVFARHYTVDLNKQFQNYIYTEGTKKDKEVGFKDRLADARNVYLDAKRQKLDAVDLSRKYQEALDQYKEILLTANGYYKAALMGGTDPKVLIQSLVKSRVGRAEAIAIVTGAFGKYDQAYIRK